jgi:hypothetical protein
MPWFENRRREIDQLLIGSSRLRRSRRLTGASTQAEPAGSARMPSSPLVHPFPQESGAETAESECTP